MPSQVSAVLTFTGELEAFCKLSRIVASEVDSNGSLDGAKNIAAKNEQKEMLYCSLSLKHSIESNRGLDEKDKNGH